MSCCWFGWMWIRTLQLLEWPTLQWLASILLPFLCEGWWFLMDCSYLNLALQESVSPKSMFQLIVITNGNLDVGSKKLTNHLLHRPSPRKVKLNLWVFNLLQGYCSGSSTGYEWWNQQIPVGSAAQTNSDFFERGGCQGFGENGCPWWSTNHGQTQRQRQDRRVLWFTTSKESWFQKEEEAACLSQLWIWSNCTDCCCKVPDKGLIGVNRATGSDNTCFHKSY